MEITLYGTESANYTQVVNSISNLLTEAGIDFRLKENENIDEFLNKKITSVPAIEIAGEDIISLKKNGEFVQSLRLLLLNILRKNNFGNMLKIVLPTDFSDYSKIAFDFAKMIATQNQSIIMASHIFTPDIVELNGVIHTSYTHEKACREKLTKFVENYRAKACMDLKVDPLIIDEFLVGYPAKEITKLAKNKNADLIVMSTRAPQSFLKRWLGSVANEVVSNTNVPTLLIPPNTKINNFKKIILALESPEDLKHILPKIQWVKQMKDSHIEVLHIKNTDIDEDIDFDLVICEHLDWPLKFNAIQAKKPTDILLNLSEADTNDLIIIYHKDRSWLLDFLNKSDSKKIIGHMKVPILVVV